MGRINISMMGSFPEKNFTTSAENGGHVCALKRSIEFLSDQLGKAVINDAKCTVDGVSPPKSPLGFDE